MSAYQRWWGPHVRSERCAAELAGRDMLRGGPARTLATRPADSQPGCESVFRHPAL